MSNGARCGVCGVIRVRATDDCEECGAPADVATRRLATRIGLVAAGAAIAVSLSACYGAPPRPQPNESPTPPQAAPSGDAAEK